MKISLALSVLILAAAACYHWRGSQRLAVVRENHTQLTVQAATLGITLDSSHPGDPARATRRERENMEVDVKAIASELIAIAKKMEAAGDRHWSINPNQQKDMTEIMSRMISLNPAHLKTLIAEVLAAKGLQDATRQQLISFSLMILANDHPQDALAFMTESPDFFKEVGWTGGADVASPLITWAKDDPVAALEWARKNGEKFSAPITDDTKLRMLVAAAENDPKLALKLISEVNMKDASDAPSQIAASATTPSERTATLTALRDYLAAMPDEKARTAATEKSVGGLARGLAEYGFTAATRWIAGANLTPTELESIATSLSYSSKPAETSQWIDWVSKKLPAEKSEAHIRKIVAEWTQNDCQAAGKWLSTASASPTKNAAIRSYAQTVATLDPATATQWAMTLPPGPDREATLKHIQDNPPTK